VFLYLDVSWSSDLLPLHSDKTKTVSSLTIPVFLWSELSLLPVQNAQVLDTLTPEDLEYSLYSLLNVNMEVGAHAEQDNNLRRLLKQVRGTPEIIALFVLPQLRTDEVTSFSDAYDVVSTGGMFPNLQRIMESSKSSFVAPYFTIGNHVSLLEVPLTHVSDSIKQGSIVISRDASSSSMFSLLSKLDGVSTVSMEDLKELLRGHSNVFASGVTDLLIVCFDNSSRSLASYDALLGEMTALLSNSTSGNYVALFTANTPSPSSLLWQFPEEQVFPGIPPAFLHLALPNNNANITSLNYLSGPILESLVVVFILLTMLFVGLCCLLDVQTPDRFENPNKDSRKKEL